MLSRTKCNMSRLRSFGLLGRLRGSRDGKAKFSLLVRRVSVVTGRPHIKTNRVSGVNSKNLLHIQLDNYSRINAHSTEKYTVGIDVHSTGEMIVAGQRRAENTVAYRGRTIRNNRRWGDNSPQRIPAREAYLKKKILRAVIRKKNSFWGSGKHSI